MTVTAERLENGGLRLNCGVYAAELCGGFDAKALDIASEMLIEKIAGVSKHDFVMAVARAVLPDGGTAF